MACPELWFDLLYFVLDSNLKNDSCSLYFRRGKPMKMSATGTSINQHSSIL